jgi:hypothetical protein
MSFFVSKPLWDQSPAFDVSACWMIHQYLRNDGLSKTVISDADSVLTSYKFSCDNMRKTLWEFKNKEHLFNRGPSRNVTGSYVLPASKSLAITYA